MDKDKIFRIIFQVIVHIGFVGESELFIHLQCRRLGFDLWVGKIIPWRRAWQLSPVFLPGESHGQRSQAGDSPCDHKEPDMTEVTQRARIPL